MQCLFRINYTSLHYKLQDVSSQTTTTECVETTPAECETVENKRFIKTAKMMVLEEIEAATPSTIELFNIPLNIELLAT